MAIEETITLEAVIPHWLEPDNDENIPPVALRELYGRLPLKVGQALESARRGMRDGFVRGVLEAHAILAGKVKDGQVSFKEWCLAAGINYETARSIVKRAAAKAKPKPDPEPDPEPEPEGEQAGKGASNRRPVGSDAAENEDEDEAEEDEPEGDPESEPKPDAKPKKQGRSTLVLTFDNAVDLAQALRRLRKVKDAEGLEGEQWAEIVLRLLDFYEEKHRAQASAGEQKVA